jgi:hypothetical protein
MHRFIGRVAKTLDVQHSCFGEVGLMEGLQSRTASMCQSGVATQPLEERRP